MKLRSYSVLEDGNYEFNDLLFGVRPYYLTPENSQVNPSHPEQITVAANGTSVRQSLFCVDEGSFEGDYLTAEYGTDASGNPLYMKVDILDDVSGRPITGQPCHITTLFGTGQRPLVLPESVFLDKKEALVIQIYDLSGSTNWIRPVLHGQRIFTERMRDRSLDEYREKRIIRKRYIRPYICPTDDDISLTGGSGNRTEVQYSNDAVGHFVVKKLTYFSSYPFKFRIWDESGQQLTRSWVHATAGLGTAQYPFLLYGSLAIRARGIVRVEVESLPNSAGDYNDDTIYFTFIGYQFYN